MSARLTVSIDGTVLTDAFAVRMRPRANDDGDGEFSLLPDDPHRSLCVDHAIVTFTKDGTDCFWIRIESVNEIEAEEGSDDDTTRIVVSGPGSTADLAKVAIQPPYFGIAGTGQATGRQVSVEPWDSLRLFGYPDPAQATQLLGTAGGAYDVTAVADERPEGWPDPQPYFVGSLTPASDVYFAGRIGDTDMLGSKLSVFVASRGELWLYHQGVLVCHVPASEYNPTKCHVVEVPVNPGVTQVFTARVRTEGTSEGNALFALTAHDPDNPELFFFKTHAGGGQTWGMFADPATPPGCTPGELLLQIFDEHEAIFGPVGWNLNFTATTDSAGVPWPTIPIFPCQVGDTLPQVLERLGAWVDWGTTPGADGLTLSMWSAAGVETPSGPAVGRGTVREITLHGGEDGQLADLSREQTSMIVNALMVKWARGFVLVSDEDSVTTYGHHVATLDAGEISDLATVERIARQNLAITATPVVSVEASLDDTDPASGWSPVTDFWIGDTLNIVTSAGTEALRWVGGEISQDGDYLECDLFEWGTSRDSLEEQTNRWMTRTQNGTLDGRSPTPVVSVSSPSIIRQGVARWVSVPFRAVTSTYAVAVGDSAARARPRVAGILAGVNLTAEVPGLADTTCSVDVDGTTVLTGITLPAGEDDFTVWLDYSQLVKIDAPDSQNVEITAAGGCQGWAANLLIAPIGEQPS